MLYPELKVLATLLILKVVDKIRMTQQPCKHYTLNGEVLKRKGKMVVGKDAVAQLFLDNVFKLHGSNGCKDMG
ncbi:hypothetical protein PHAVU_006G020600 [Phaseolus vulgaris]|uniref:Uncharacterized protein n=1 Tax=Phaseolus vulgaris TaxID=3885 RepID=V7BMB3_PHAVU|nr:hypothetical protein PHAVU_006G020600g [Phaseolus vulgaris]ESW18190.1 hypothetical protein PHAVU_006G020600g [Phaseolus vulgaris]